MADYFENHGGEVEREVYNRAIEASGEVIGALTHLFPALAVSNTVLLVLQEMIWREIWAAFTTQPEESFREEVSAWQLANDVGYINWAIRSGLRHGTINQDAEDSANAAFTSSMPEELRDMIESVTKKKPTRLH